MSQITIRGISPEIEEEIRKIARDSHKSINQVIREILHKEFDRRRSPASSLKTLAGGWTAEEAEAFERSIRSCEEVDEDMWK